MKLAAVVVLAFGLGSLQGCQDDVATPFPPGLEPLEDNRVPDASGPPKEELRSLQGRSGSTNQTHGRGFVFTDPATLWSLTKDPAAMVARCRTNVQTVTSGDDPMYELDYVVHYVVNDIVTVEWDDQWRYGIIDGTSDAPVLGMIRHQKINGSDFISLSEGTIQVIATDDPNISELAFVEHLDAISGNAGDLLEGMQDNYARLVALAHDLPRPSCP
jgi:hypothetical protein